MKKWLKKNRFMLIGILLGLLLAGLVIGLSIAFPGSVLLLPWIWFEGLSLINMTLVSAGVIAGTGIIGGAIGKGIDVFGATIANNVGLLFKQVGSLLSNAWNNLFKRKDVSPAVSSALPIKSLNVKPSNGANESKLKDSRSRSSSLSTHSSSSTSPRPVSLTVHSVLAPSNHASRSRASSNSEGSHQAQKSLKDILKILNEIDTQKPGWQGAIAQLREELLKMKQEVVLEELKQQGKTILNGLVEEIKKEKHTSKEIETLLEKTMMKKLKIMFHPDKLGNNELAQAIANQIESWWEELKQTLQEVDNVKVSGFSVSEWISKIQTEQSETREVFKKYSENLDKLVEEQKHHNKKVNEFFTMSDQYGKRVDAEVKLVDELVKESERQDAAMEVIKKEAAILEKEVLKYIATRQADESDQSGENVSKQRRKTW